MVALTNLQIVKALFSSILEKLLFTKITPKKSPETDCFRAKPFIKNATLHMPSII